MKGAYVTNLEASARDSENNWDILWGLSYWQVLFMQSQAILLLIVGCHFLLQGIFLTRGLDLRSPTLQADSLPSEPNTGIGEDHFGILHHWHQWAYSAERLYNCGLAGPVITLPNSAPWQPLLDPSTSPGPNTPCMCPTTVAALTQQEGKTAHIGDTSLSAWLW